MPYGDPASVWTLGTPLTDINTFRIYAGRTPNANNTIKVTQVDDTVVDISDQVTEPVGWWDITGVTSIKSVEIHAVNSSNNVIQLFAFEVDGRVLVDQGVWNASQNWSDYMTATDGFTEAAPATKGFNGAVGDNDIAQGASTTNPNYVVFTLPVGIPYSSSVEVYITNAANQVSVNSTNLQSIGANAWVQVASGSGTLNQIVFQRNQAAGASFAGIKVDGAILVDAGAQLNTDQVWSEQGSFTGHVWN